VRSGPGRREALRPVVIPRDSRHLSFRGISVGPDPEESAVPYAPVMIPPSTVSEVPVTKSESLEAR
jgi:hypothetical protein